MFDLKYVSRRFIVFNLCNLLAAIFLLVIFVALLIPALEIDQGSVAFWAVLMAMVFELGLFIVFLSSAVLYENVCRQRNGDKTLGLNRFGSWAGGNYLFNTLVNFIWLGGGVYLIFLAGEIVFRKFL